MNKTDIEWCDFTWNPVSGCTKVSEGCRNCYAERHAKRFWGARKFTDVRTHPERLDEPLLRKKPSVIFVNSMSDLFHLTIPREFVDCVFLRMLQTPRHIYLVLTKRPEIAVAHFEAMNKTQGARVPFIPPNVWVGVSVEDQKSADERIPALLKLPTQNLFVSAEPLLGPIDFTDLNYRFDNSQLDCLRCDEPDEDCKDVPVGTNTIKWVIVGGESGPEARPMHPDWARSIRDQCKAAHVPFFFKQWGEWFPRSQWEHNPDLILPGDDCFLTADNFGAKTRYLDDDHEITHRVGRKAAGRLLDGREYLEYPEAIAGVKR